MGSEHTEGTLLAQDEISKRDKSLSVGKIDEAYIAKLAIDGWRRANEQRAEYLDTQETLEAAWRDLTSQEKKGPWDNSANFKSKLILKYGKATHARLWQLFSNPSGFYQTEARQEPFKDRELQVKRFMDFVIESYANGKQGCKAEFDAFLWDVVFKGSGYLKAYWKREVHEYEEVVPTLEVTEKIVFDGSPTGRPVSESKLIEKETVKVDIIETPQVRRAMWEDICMPMGFSDPQESPWVSHRVYFTDEDLKVKAEQGMFYKDAVEEALQSRPSSIYGQDDDTNDIKRSRVVIDGQNIDLDAFDQDQHVVLEWYGKAYVEPSVEEREIREDLSKLPREIVAWVHKQTGRVLGWTYLHRISPGGIRPIFKGDFVKFTDRQNGVGTAELIYEEQRYEEAVTNMRLDNGMLASMPMFAYRQSSGLKAQNLRVKPGQGIPVDDVNDMKVFQFPFLQGFGYQEAGMMESKAQGLLAVDEITVGISPDKVGALRTASGSNQLAQNSGIQLEIHFDRIARCINKLLQFLFRLSRERMPHALYYRVTGERGEPIFGRVNREDLKGEYDFKISVDILGQSQLEKQQQSVLLMQTLLNPAFMQTGVVMPENLYNLCKNFLKVHKMGRVDDFITKPQGYEDKITPSERLYRLSFGLHTNPPVESTVRLDEDHAAALAAYDAFEQSDLFGLMNQDGLAALTRLRQAHMSMQQAQQAGGNPNLSGMQVPRDGFQGVNSNGPGGNELAAMMPAMGEANGPVV
jgi:hypothetical protein